MANTGSRQATLLGVPLDLGAENLGVDVGPDAFRYQKIAEKLEHVGLHITDVGNIECKDRSLLDAGDPRLRYAAEIARVNREVADITQTAITKGHRVIALGGDHSINLGVMSGASAALDGDIGLVYLDAHGDINTPETTLTGNIHGMHLAALMGFGDERLVHLHHRSVKLDKNNLLHIGASDMDNAEWELVKREGLVFFSLLDLLSYGLAPLLRKIEELGRRVPNIWVSLDLDVIDRVYAPAAAMPNRGGLTYREIAAVADFVGHNCNVIGIDVVEYNPLQDEERKTAELGIELIAKFLGSNYSWYTNYLDHNKLS